MTTYALVLETNNLTGGGADVARTVASLERLFVRMREQTRPLSSLAAFAVTHDGLPADARAALDRAAGVAIRWVQLAAGVDYYEAKNVGFDAVADADVVAFADADCWPEPCWLDELLAVSGGENVLAASGVRYPKISMEEVLRSKPDIILDASFAARASAKEWTTVDVPAVKTGRVVVISDEYMIAPSPRVKQALDTMAKAIAAPAQ